MKKKKFLREMIRFVRYSLAGTRKMDKVYSYLQGRYPDGMRVVNASFRYRKYAEMQISPGKYKWMEKVLDKLFRNEFIHYISRIEKTDEAVKHKEQMKVDFLKRNQSNEDMDEKYRKFSESTKFWKRTETGIHYISVFDYLPEKRNADTGYGDMDRLRRKVWTFKYGSSYITPIHHAYILTELARKISGKLQFFFKGELKDITLVCIPASDNAIHQLRYREFSRYLCHLTGMRDTMDYIAVKGQRTPKHLGGDRKMDFVLDEKFFTGKFIILFDDVVTSGKSALLVKNRLEEAGAKVIGAIFMAETVLWKRKGR